MPNWTNAQRFLAGIPLVGASIKVEVERQLLLRTTDYVELWNETELELDLYLAFQVAKILKDAQRFPNDYFVPADPCIYFFVDDEDALTPNFLADDISRIVDVKFTEACWDAIEHRTYGNFITVLTAERSSQSESARERKVMR